MIYPSLQFLGEFMEADAGFLYKGAYAHLKFFKITAKNFIETLERWILILFAGVESNVIHFFWPYSKTSNILISKPIFIANRN